jgi:hypothetical protein
MTYALTNFRGIWIAQIVFFDKSHSDHGKRSPPYISPCCFEDFVGWVVPTDIIHFQWPHQRRSHGRHPTHDRKCRPSHTG